VNNALLSLGVQATISDDPALIEKSDAVIFPGVGSFGQVKSELDSNNLSGPLKNFAQSGKPILGICLGMQIFFEKGYEGEQPSDGLGLLEGEVVPLDPKLSLRIPHIGWNSLNLSKDAEFKDLLKNHTESPQVYFVHSFYCSATNKNQVVATTEPSPGYTIPVMVKKNNIYGMQFHPERSGKVGLRFLKNFIDIAAGQIE